MAKAKSVKKSNKVVKAIGIEDGFEGDSPLWFRKDEPEVLMEYLLGEDHEDTFTFVKKNFTEKSWQKMTEQ